MVNSSPVNSDYTCQISVLVACHNRSATTKKFFESFLASSDENIAFEHIIVDDGSTDNTAEILRDLPVKKKILLGNGNLFWARAMSLAESNLTESPDGILWVNDDTVLKNDAFIKLLDAISKFPRSVIVGQVEDSRGSIIYGGYKRVGLNPLSLRLLNTKEDYSLADTFNGNFVYIPAEIKVAVGPIDGIFMHAYADCDYGYRVRNLGYEIIVMPDSVGIGITNSISWPRSRIGKIRQISGKKFSPIKSQVHFFRKHSRGIEFFLIPLFLLIPYFRILFFNKLKISSSGP